MRSDLHRTLARYPILAVGATGAAFSMIKTGRDAVFFSNTGIDQLPWVNLWSEVGLAVGAFIHLSAMKKFGTRRTRTGVFLASGALFLTFVPLIALAGSASGLVVKVLYPAVPVVFAALFATSWLLAGDMLEGADRAITQRAYSWTGASAMIGGIAGGLGARGLSSLLAPAHLVGVGGVVLLATGWLCASAHARRRALMNAPGAPPPPAAAGTAPAAPAELEGIAGDAAELLRHPYTRMLFAISSLAALAAMYVEFQFYAAAFLAGKAGPQFFADYHVFLCIASLAFNLVVTPSIQNRYGVARALLVLPAGVLGGAGVVALTASVATQSTFRVIETSLKNSIHRSSWEQVFLRFNSERRAAMKMIVDGIVPRVAGVAGSLGLYFIISSERVMGAVAELGTWLAWLLVPVAALWMYATASLERAKTAPAGCAPLPPPGEGHRARLPDS